MNLFTPYLVAIGLWLSGLVPLESFPPFVQQVIIRYQQEGAGFLTEDARVNAQRDERNESRCDSGRQ